jgi:flagellar biosynthesis GTPase FlhF
VTKERELQIKLKNERKGDEAFEDRDREAYLSEKYAKEEERKKKTAFEAKIQRIQLAQTHIAQAKQKRLNDMQEKKVPDIDSGFIRVWFAFSEIGQGISSPTKTGE